MGELFIRYPIGSTVEHDGRECRVLGYETYDSRKILLCVVGDEECRIDVERMERI